MQQSYFVKSNKFKLFFIFIFYRVIFINSAQLIYNMYQPRESNSIAIGQLNEANASWGYGEIGYHAALARLYSEFESQYLHLKDLH